MRPLPRGNAFAFAALTFVLAFPAAAQTANDPAAVVREFFVRYAGGDFRGAAELWVAGAPADKFVAEHRLRQEKRCMRLESLVVTRLAEDVVTTAQTLALHAAPPDSIEWMESSRSRFVLRHDGARWRIAEWISIDRELVEQEQSADTTAFVKQACRRAAAEFVAQGQYDAADDLVRSASAIAERLGDPVAMATAATAQSMVYLYVGEYDSSITAATEAVLWAERSGDPDTLARTLIRLARAVEGREGRPPVEPLERALSLADQLEDMAHATQAAIHLGRAHELRGRRRNVMHYAELASRYAERSNDLPTQMNAALYLGGAYSWIGDLELAEQHIRRGYELSQKGGFKGTKILAIAALADNLMWRVSSDEALRFLDERLRTIPPSEAIELVLKRARAHLMLGNLDQANCDIDLAASIDDDRAQAAHIEFLRASIALRRGDDQQALAHLEGAQPHLPMNGWIRSLLAEVLLNLGREDEARTLLEELIAADDSAPMTDPQRLLFQSAINRDHRQLIQLHVEARDARSALNVSEEMKAASLRQALTDGRVDPHQYLTSEDRQHEELLDERIRELNRRFVAGDRSATEAKAIRNDLTQARNELRDFRQRAYARQPATRVQRPAELDLDRLPADLDDVTIISYVAGEQKTFAFVIGPKRGGHRTLTARTIATDIPTLHQQINRFAQLVEQRNLRTPELAAELYDVLLAPFEDDLRSARLVCFVPDSALWRVPFHALGRDGSALIERLPVFYSPSISVLAATVSMRARKTADSPKLLALANATVSSETASLYRAFDPDAPLGPIPETEVEVREIGRIYGRDATRIYTGSAARETTFKREAPAYDILHIATHGVMHPAAPMFSSLVLNATPDEEDDGVLEAREIATLPLDASMAVLSACDTGKADGVQGNAVVGLSWAFLAAGCPTTVVSQWKAQSAATATMMVDFHRHLADGIPTPEALRRAQLALRRNPRYRNPFYWAPFVVIGAP